MIKTEHILEPGRSRVQPGLCALAIMTKAPEAGRVKTRLYPPLTAEEAAELNKCFLKDIGLSIYHSSETSPGKGVAVYTPVGKEWVYEGIFSEGFQFLPQRGQDFGERLRNAGTDLLRVGFDSFCLINSDSPMVPGSSFVRASRLLSQPGDRVVLGPSEDGGYYLIGLKHVHARLFEEIDWSTERVFEQTKARAQEIGLEIEALPIGLDVDDHATLAVLCQRLLESEDERLAANSRKFLQEIIAREGRARIWPEA